MLLKVVLCSLCFSMSLFAQEDSWQIGETWAQEIESEYQKGEFESLFNEEALKRLSEEEDEMEISQMEQLLDEMESYEQKLLPIKKQRNESLLKVAEEYPDYLVSQVVQKVVSYEQNFLQKDEFSSISLEGQELFFLQRILNRYVLKNDYLEYQREDGKFSFHEFETYQVVATLEFFKELGDLGNQLENQNLLQEAQKEREEFLSYVAQRHNWRYLSSLAKGYRYPENEAEEKVQKILKTFFEQKEAILEQGL